MPNTSLPPIAPHSAIRSAFDTAQASFERERMRNGASRQIAGPQIAPSIASANAPVSVERAIASASQQTGVDFDFLVAQAQVESAMDPAARARTSSATGLYQFIESTWLETMHRHGDRFGLGNVSAHIRTSPDGSAHVPDAATRQSILDLRNDPQIASLMAAGLAEDNRAHLAPILGRQPEHNELYLAHFLGAGGAGRFLEAMAQNPQQSAANLFRRPAAANRPVFYEPGGSPRSLQGVMDYLSGKLERARAMAPIAGPNLAGPNLAGPNLAGPNPAVVVPPASAPPYLIADEAAFAPQSPPVITGQNRPRIAQSPALRLAEPGQNTAHPPGHHPTTHSSMSNMLRATIDETGGHGTSRASREQITRAYEQLKALGF